MYVGLFPCNECAKVIIQSGLKTIIYMSDKYSYKIKTIAAKRMFDAANVKYTYDFLFFFLELLYLIGIKNIKFIFFLL